MFVHRYPTFTDAIRDIDDALCMIFLFASLPSKDRISASLVENCSRLAAEWQLVPYQFTQSVGSLCLFVRLMVT
jgi:hypothetical protein